MKLLSAVAFLAFPHLAVADAFTVGSARADRGHVATGMIEVPATAPAAGIILYICSVPSMSKGGTIANVGVVRAGS